MATGTVCYTTFCPGYSPDYEDNCIYFSKLDDIEACKIRTIEQESAELYLENVRLKKILKEKFNYEYYY